MTETLKSSRSILTIVLLLLLGGSSSADEWPRFRGPNGSGISSATTVPVSFSESDYRWRVTLPGEGHSSPVVHGDRLFVTAADQKKGTRWLVAIDTGAGKIAWKRSADFSAYKKHKMNSFASSTPAADEKHVYALWQSREESSLTAFDRSGEKVWSFDVGPFGAGQGGATSPIVFGDVVILANDQENGSSYLVALDRMSGRQRWRVARPGDRACYSTPCVYARPGQPTEIIFTHSYEGITAIDLERGTKAWEIDVFGTHKQRACGSPIIHGDLVIGSSGFVTAEKNVVMVRPRGKQGARSVEEILRVSRSAPHVPTPLVYRDRMYLLGDKGIMTSVRMKDGSKVWQGRVGGNYFASPVCVDGKIYCVTRRGEVVVVDTGDDFEVLSRQSLGEPSAATPAVAGGVMYLRTDSSVIALGGE